jgi:hypothetical protein
MASLVLSGDTSGSITVSAPAVAGSNTQTLVATTGTLAPIVSGTAITLTNQTAPEFTSIPSWAKRITVMLVGVSTNSTGAVLIQVGSGSYSTSNYLSSCGAINAGTGQAGSTSGLVLTTSSLGAANNFSGAITLSLVNSNQWVSSGNAQYNTSTGAIFMTAGYTPALSGALDRIRLYIDGTQQFDAGTFNIIYE